MVSEPQDLGALDLMEDERFGVRMGRSFKELRKEIGSISELKSFINKHFNLPHIQVTESFDGGVIISDLFEGIPDDIESQDHESFDRILKLIGWIEGCIELPKCSDLDAHKVFEEMPQPTHNKQIVPSEDFDENSRCFGMKYYDQMTKEALRITGVQIQSEELVQKGLKDEPFVSKVLSNVNTHQVLEEMPRSINNFETKSIEQKWLNQTESCTLLVPLMGVSFDPGGKCNVTLESNVAKEPLNLVAYQVFDKQADSEALEVKQMTNSVRYPSFDIVSNEHDYGEPKLDYMEECAFDPGGQLVRKLTEPCLDWFSFEGVFLLKFDVPIETSCLLLNLMHDTKPSIDIIYSVECLIFDPRRGFMIGDFLISNVRDFVDNEHDLQVLRLGSADDQGDLKDFNMRDVKDATPLLLAKSEFAGLFNMLSKLTRQNKMMKGSVGALCFDPGGEPVGPISGLLSLKQVAQRKSSVQCIIDLGGVYFVSPITHGSCCEVIFSTLLVSSSERNQKWMVSEKCKSVVDMCLEENAYVGMLNTDPRGGQLLLNGMAQKCVSELIRICCFRQLMGLKRQDDLAIALLEKFSELLEIFCFDPGGEHLMVVDMLSNCVKATFKPLLVKSLESNSQRVVIHGNNESLHCSVGFPSLVDGFMMGICPILYADGIVAYLRAFSPRIDLYLSLSAKGNAGYAEYMPEDEKISDLCMFLCGFLVKTLSIQLCKLLGLLEIDRSEASIVRLSIRVIWMSLVIAEIHFRIGINEARNQHTHKGADTWSDADVYIQQAVLLETRIMQVVDFHLKLHEYHLTETDYSLAYVMLTLNFIYKKPKLGRTDEFLTHIVCLEFHAFCAKETTSEILVLRKGNAQFIAASSAVFRHEMEISQDCWLLLVCFNPVEIASLILKEQGHCFSTKIKAMGLCSRLPNAFQPLIPENKSTTLFGDELEEVLHVKEATAKVIISRIAAVHNLAWIAIENGTNGSSLDVGMSFANCISHITCLG